MKSVIGSLAVLLVCAITGVTDAQSEVQTATQEFQALVEELKSLRENDKLTPDEWSQIGKVLASMSSRMKGRTDEQKVEILQTTTDRIVTLLEGEDFGNGEGRGNEGVTPEDKEQAAAELLLEQREQELKAKERLLVERFERVQAIEKELLEKAAEAAEANRARAEDAEQPKSDVQQLANGLSKGLELLLDKEGGVDGGDVRELLDGLEGGFKMIEQIESLNLEELNLEALDGLGLDMEKINEELGQWAKDNADDWGPWAERLEDSASGIGELIEQMSSEELEPWANDFSQKMGAWVEKLEAIEAGELDGEEIAGLIEDNLKVLGELPLREIYQRAQNEFDGSDLFTEDSIDELGLLAFRSIHEALSIVQDNGGTESLQVIEEIMGEMFDENGEVNPEAVLSRLMKVKDQPKRSKAHEHQNREEAIDALQQRIDAMQRELKRLQDELP